jgi:hypothetical protein
VRAEAVQATAAQLAFTGPGTLTYVLAGLGALMVLFGLALVGATKERKPVFVA